jgi:hypothetical protein
MRNYANLDDHDFEMLVADLLGAELEVRFERFARGPDAGIDLRSPYSDSGRHIVQCKHYLRSTVAQLVEAAAKERSRLEAAPPDLRLRSDDTYWFVTSLGLTPAAKQKIVAGLDPFLAGPEHIVGVDELEGLLDVHPDVERRQVKLWLQSWGQLDASLNAGRHQRSGALLREIGRRIGRYVPPSIYPEASRRLAEKHVLVIAGAPGIGKTTLAHMLIAESVAAKFDIVEVVTDIDEAWSALRPGQKQLFYYDDFLGRTALQARLGKNEDSLLVRLMRLAAEEEDVRFVLTTREHILQDAKLLHEKLAHGGLDDRRILLALSDYSPLERARIVTGHMHTAALPNAAVESLFDYDRSWRWPLYWEIVLHPNFTPRQVEWICGLGPYKLPDEAMEDFAQFALHALGDPAEIWTYAFETEFDEHQRILTLVLAAMPRRVSVADLERAWSAAVEVYGGSTRNRSFERCMAILEGTVFGVDLEGGERFARLLSPGIEDFAKGWLIRSSADSRAVLESAVFFEQVSWFWEALGRWSGPPDEALIPLFVEAVERTLGTGSSLWRVEERDDGKAGASRVTELAGVRLVALEQMRRGRAGDYELFSGVWCDAVDLAVREWRRGAGGRDDALEAARVLDGAGELDGEVLTVLKQRLLGDLTSAEQFLAAADLRDLDEALLPDDELADLQARLRTTVDRGSGWPDLDEAECEDRILHGRSATAALYPGLQFPRSNHGDNAVLDRERRLYDLKQSGQAAAVEGVFERFRETSRLGGLTRDD